MPAPACLHFLCGKAGAGKSTLAKALAKAHHAILISEDIWLARLFGDQMKTFEDYKSYAQRAKTVVGPLVIDLLNAGQNVVLDFPANTRTSRAWYRSLYEAAAADHVLHYVNVADRTCLQRIEKRNTERPEGSHHLTQEDFAHISSFFEAPGQEEGFRMEVHAAAGAMEPPVIVLHGPTSAGKSSIAKALQESSVAPAFHVTLDAFVTMSRRRDMRSLEEQGLAHRIHCENLRSTLQRLVPTQFEIVLDLVLRDEAELRACFEVLSARPMYLIGVQAPLDVLEQREHSREDRATGMAREQVAHPAFARPYDLVIDTSTCTPDESAAAIRRFIHEQPRPTAHSSEASRSAPC